MASQLFGRSAVVLDTGWKVGEVVWMKSRTAAQVDDMTDSETLQRLRFHCSVSIANEETRALQDTVQITQAELLRQSQLFLFGLWFIHRQLESGCSCLTARGWSCRSSVKITAARTHFATQESTKCELRLFALSCEPQDLDQLDSLFCSWVELSKGHRRCCPFTGNLPALLLPPAAAYDTCHWQSSCSGPIYILQLCQPLTSLQGHKNSHKWHFHLCHVKWEGILLQEKVWETI